MRLNHVGISVKNLPEFVRLMLELGICEIYEDKMPRSCKMQVGCSCGILQLHEGPTATGVKPAIEVENLNELRRRLTENGIRYRVRSGHTGVIDFEICGLSIHTVAPETQGCPSQIQTELPTATHRAPIRRDFRQWAETPEQALESEGYKQ